MLGYIKPLKDQLRLCEWNRYQAVYCGLCKVLGANYGFLPRFAVNFDATFLALFFLAFQAEEGKQERKFCAIAALRPKPVAAVSAELNFAAGLSAYLFAARGDDDRADGQALRGRIELAIFRAAAHNFAAQYPALTDHLGRQFAELRLFEQTQAARLALDDAALLEELNTAAAFNGSALRTIFVTAAAQNPVLAAQPALLTTVGLTAQYLGEWMYVLDALDDRNADLSKGRYNPLAVCGAEQALSIASSRLGYLEAQIDLHASLLPYVKDAAIIENILCLGLPAQRRQVEQRYRTKTKLTEPTQPK